MACTPGPSGLMGLPEAVHHTYPKLQALLYAGEQLCQLTIELCSSSKLSRAFARGNDTMMVASGPVRLQAPIPHLKDAILRCQLVYQTAEAEASIRHHHGCLCSRDPAAACNSGRVCLVCKSISRRIFAKFLHVGQSGAP